MPRCLRCCLQRFFTIAFVGVHLCWYFKAASCQASNHRNRVHAFLQHFGSHICSHGQDHLRDTSAIYNVEPNFPPSDWLGPGSGLPGGLIPLMPARLQSICLCSRKRVRMACCNCSKIPATIPVAQTCPASYAGAVPKNLGKIFLCNVCLQHERRR